MKRRARGGSPELAEKLRAEQLDAKVAEAIERLPIQAQEALLEWVADGRLRGASGEPLTPADAAFRAVEAAVVRERARISPSVSRAARGNPPGSTVRKGSASRRRARKPAPDSANSISRGSFASSTARSRPRRSCRSAV